MNLLGAGALTPADVASMAADVGAIASDTDGATEVTWHPKGAPRAYDAARGTVAYAGTPTTFYAWMGPADAKASDVDAGDVELLIRTSDVAAPGVDDQLVAGGVRMFVVRVTPAPWSSHTLVLARRVP